MAFGMYIKNSSGETVVGDNSEPYVLSRSGTRTGVQSGSYYRFPFVPLNITDDEIIVVNPRASQWICPDCFLATVQAGNNEHYMSSNQEYIDYFIFDKASNVGASTSGYGMWIKNSSGDVIFNINHSVAAIKAMWRYVSGSYDNVWSGTSAWITGGFHTLEFGNNGYGRETAPVVANNSGDVRFYYRYVYDLGNGNNLGSATYQSDSYFVLADTD